MAAGVQEQAPQFALQFVPEMHGGRGEAFQISTAPGTDGIVRRIEVRATSPDHQGD